METITQKATIVGTWTVSQQFKNPHADVTFHLEFREDGSVFTTSFITGPFYGTYQVNDSNEIVIAIANFDHRIDGHSVSSYLGKISEDGKEMQGTILGGKVENKNFSVTSGNWKATKNS